MEARRGPGDHRFLAGANRCDGRRAEGRARLGQGPGADLGPRVVAGALALDPAFLLEIRQHPVEVVRVIELHLLADLGDLDPRIVADDLHGLVRPGAAAAAPATGPART